jgi:hypothetical protein
MVSHSLSRAELKLRIPGFCGTLLFYDVAIVDFFVIFAPGVRKDSVRWYLKGELSKIEGAIGVDMQ